MLGTQLDSVLSALTARQTQAALTLVAAAALIPYILDRRRRLLAEEERTPEVKLQTWRGFGRMAAIILAASLGLWLLSVALFLLQNPDTNIGGVLFAGAMILLADLLVIGLLAINRIVVHEMRKRRN